VFTARYELHILYN